MVYESRTGRERVKGGAASTSGLDRREDWTGRDRASRNHSVLRSATCLNRKGDHGNLGDPPDRDHLAVACFIFPSSPRFGFPSLQSKRMSSQTGHTISPPPVPASNAASGGSGVRRHHTISAASRSNRPTSKIAISELEDPQTEQIWNDDEVVDQDWVGGIGAVGEKSSLHRQASLPTRYHRGESVSRTIAHVLTTECCFYATKSRTEVKLAVSQARTHPGPSTAFQPLPGMRAKKKNGSERCAACVTRKRCAF